MRFPILVVSLWLTTSPLWGKIVFRSVRDGNGEIYKMDVDGSNQKRLTFNNSSDSSPVWSPNGQQIAFMGERDKNWEVYVMDAAGGNQRNLTHHPKIDGNPDWSPDGSHIAFTSGRGGNAEIDIFVMDADGSNVRQITHMGFASRPKWSPDGKRILFEAVTDNGREIYVIDADGRNRWKISFPNIEAGMFARGWSPDGKQVLYTEAVGHSVNNATFIIATLHPTRREVTNWERVPLPKMPISGGAWGADGKSILFSSRPPDGPLNLDWNIYRFHFNGRQLIQLTHHARKDSSPHEWNPRLSVQPQQLLPLFWGEIKSNRLRH